MWLCWEAQRTPASIHVHNVARPRSTVTAALDRMWRWVEATSPGVLRGEPESWFRLRGLDPWPCAQRDMMQLHQAGWLFPDLRERFAERVFEPLYGTRELHCSKDGVTYQRPTSRDLGCTPNDHFDQGSTSLGLQCIQGSVALATQLTHAGDGHGARTRRATRPPLPIGSGHRARDVH